jgi:SAM-dependent methyltransferase
MAERPLHPSGDRARQGEPLLPAHVYARERDWPGYFRALANLPARETLLKALGAIEAERSGAGPGPEGPAVTPPHAIDLGCGDGRDTCELLGRGWRVTAIDGHPEAFERLLARSDLTWRERLATRCESFETLDVASLAPPASVGLVNASFALPFCSRAQFPGLWADLVALLYPGGRFAGQFFGDRDDWAKLPDRTHHTKEQAMALLANFDVEHFAEEDRPTTNPDHAKHWHLFHVVARKR